MMSKNHRNQHQFEAISVGSINISTKKMMSALPSQIIPSGKAQQETKHQHHNGLSVTSIPFNPGR